MQGLEYYIRSNTKLELVIHEIIDLVSRVENIHDQYEEYVEHYDTVERSTLENFARGVIEDSPLSIKGMLPRIQGLFGGPTGNEFRVLGNRGLLELIANDMNVSKIFFLLKSSTFSTLFPFLISLLHDMIKYICGIAVNNKCDLSLYSRAITSSY